MAEVQTKLQSKYCRYMLYFLVKNQIGNTTFQNERAMLNLLLIQPTRDQIHGSHLLHLLLMQRMLLSLLTLRILYLSLLLSIIMLLNNLPIKLYQSKTLQRSPYSLFHLSPYTVLSRYNKGLPISTSMVPHHSSLVELSRTTLPRSVPELQ
jgi:hypothetical protein